MQPIFHGVGLYTPTSRSIGPNIWPHYDIIVTLEGEIALQVHESAFTLHAGDAVVIPPHHNFQGRPTSASGTIWVLHYEDYTPQNTASPLLSLEPYLIHKAAPKALDRQLLEEFTTNWKAAGEAAPQQRELQLLSEWLLIRFERAAMQPHRDEPPRLRAAVDETLDGHLDYDVATMAKLAGVSLSRFRQLFNEHYGSSPLHFLSQARIEEAKRLLAETPLPIKEIAPRVGYGEVAAFHRAFYRETTHTPGAWRKRYGTIS